MRRYAAYIDDSSGKNVDILFSRTKRAIDMQIAGAASKHGAPCLVTLYTQYSVVHKDGTMDSFLTTSRKYTVSA